MAIQAARITGVKAGETILTEEQVLSGYEIDVIRPSGLNNIKYDVKAIGDAYGANHDLGAVYDGVMFYGFQAPMYFKISHDNITWSTNIFVPKEFMLSFDVKVRYWNAYRATAGVGSYAIIYCQRLL